MAAVPLPAGRQASPAKIAAGIIWVMGCIMTYAAIDQMVDWGSGAILMFALALQAVLTAGQSPVWRGRGSLISYALLLVDTIINFGGTMAVLVNVDDVGSVQALAATFAAYSGEWPLWIKGLLALGVSAMIAGLPEFLWKLD